MILVPVPFLGKLSHYLLKRIKGDRASFSNPTHLGEKKSERKKREVTKETVGQEERREKREKEENQAIMKE